MKWDYEQTLNLIELSKAGDNDARDTLLAENAPLIKSIVKRFLGRGVEYEDLFQIGAIGLLKAISGFDASFNVRFSTYAVPMVTGELKRFIRDNTPVKMPRSLKELQQKIRFCRQSLSLKNGYEPRAEEIAKELGCTVEDIIFALESMNPCASLDEPVFDEAGTTQMDLLEDNRFRAQLTDTLALRQCINQLDDKEKKVIFLRYYKDFTQTRIAEIMGISQVQISRIESRSIEKLRRKLG